MKKILMAAALLIAAQSVSAQVFIGGSLGLGFGSQKGELKETGNPDENFKINNTFNFSIAPEIGYALNDRWDVGLALGFGSEKETISKEFTVDPNDTDRDIKSSSWGIAPFARYSAIQFCNGKFEIMLKGSIYYVGSKEEPGKFDFTVGGVEDFEEGNEVKKSSIGVSITPMIAYNISDRITLTANLNCLSLGFSSDKSTATTEAAGVKSESVLKATNFNLGADTDNLFNTGNFQIGFAYNF